MYEFDEPFYREAGSIGGERSRASSTDRSRLPNTQPRKDERSGEFGRSSRSGGEGAPAGGKQDPRETILVVEDEDRTRELVIEVLYRNGYQVLGAADGNKALSVANEFKGKIQLLLTDLVMPGMSGRELAERLTQRRPELQVLYMSGYTDDEIVRHGVSRAEVAFLQKPFTLRVLTGKVRDVLDSGG